MGVIPTQEKEKWSNRTGRSVSYDFCSAIKILFLLGNFWVTFVGLSALGSCHMTITVGRQEIHDFWDLSKIFQIFMTFSLIENSHQALTREKKCLSVTVLVSPGNEAESPDFYDFCQFSSCSFWYNSRRKTGVQEQFLPRSREVIYDVHSVTEISGMINDVREECLECHMASQKYLQCLVISEKNVTSQWWRVGRCVNKTHACSNRNC